MVATHGVVHIHSAPSALCPHLEWAIGGVFGAPVNLSWSPQPAERNSYRAEHSWRAPVGTSARLASALKGWQRLRFDITEQAAEGSEAVRYSYTPALGFFHTITAANGDVLVHEGRLKRALASEALGGRPVTELIEELLGLPWDDELEPFRQAGEGAPVRWLHQVV